MVVVASTGGATVVAAALFVVPLVSDGAEFVVGSAGAVVVVLHSFPVQFASGAVVTTTGVGVVLFTPVSGAGASVTFTVAVVPLSVVAAGFSGTVGAAAVETFAFTTLSVMLGVTAPPLGVVCCGDV